MSIEAMKQALEALENLQGLCSEEGNFIEQLTIWTPEAMYALRTAIAEVEKQEPVALETVYETIIHWDEGGGKRSRRELARRIVAIYTTPPAAQPCPYIRSTAEGTHHCALSQRQPLTDDRIGQIIEQCQITLVNYCSDEKQIEFARAVEAAHGIGEKK